MLLSAEMEQQNSWTDDSLPEKTTCRQNFQLQLEVTSLLLETEQRRVSLLQAEIARATEGVVDLSSILTHKCQQHRTLLLRLRRMQKQYNQLKLEYSSNARCVIYKNNGKVSESKSTGYWDQTTLQIPVRETVMTSLNHTEAQAAVDTIFGTGRAEVVDVQTRTIVREEEVIFINGRQIQLAADEADALRAAVNSGTVPAPELLQRLLAHGSGHSSPSSDGDGASVSKYRLDGDAPVRKQQVMKASLQVNSRLSQRDTMVVMPSTPQVTDASSSRTSSPTLSRNLTDSHNGRNLDAGRKTVHESRRDVRCLATSVDVAVVHPGEVRGSIEVGRSVRVASTFEKSANGQDCQSSDVLLRDLSLGDRNKSLNDAHAEVVDSIDFPKISDRSFPRAVEENIDYTRNFQSSPVTRLKKYFDRNDSLVDHPKRSSVSTLRSSSSTVGSGTSSPSPSPVPSLSSSPDRRLSTNPTSTIQTRMNGAVSGDNQTRLVPGSSNGRLGVRSNCADVTPTANTTSRGSFSSGIDHERSDVRLTRSCTGPMARLANNDSGYINSGESEQGDDHFQNGEDDPDADIEDYIPFVDEEDFSTIDSPTTRKSPSIFNLVSSLDCDEKIDKSPTSPITACPDFVAGDASVNVPDVVQNNAESITCGTCQYLVTSPGRTGQDQVTTAAVRQRSQSVDSPTSPGHTVSGRNQRPCAPTVVKRLQFCDGDLRSATLDDLIHHLTPSLHHYPDRAFVFAFLLSARLYIRPHELLQRVTSAISLNNQMTSSKSKQNTLPKVAVGVLHLVSEWSDTFPYDFRDDAMMNELRLVAQNCIRANPDLQNEVRTVLQSLLEKLTCLESFERSVEKYNSQAVDSLTSSTTSSTTKDITNVCDSPVTLAQQLTRIELERLSFIGPEEFVQAFAKESRHIVAPCKNTKTTRNLENYVDWFNRLSYLVATEVCSHARKRERVRLVEYWSGVARECFNLGNFNSLMAIIAGLNLSPVARLKKTWSRLDNSQLNVLEQQMSPTSNFLSYRRTLQAAMWRSSSTQQSDSPTHKVIIPFFSLLIKDLYFLNEGCANRLHDNLINLDKVWQLARQVTEFIAWKQVVCPYPANTAIVDYLLTARVQDEQALRMASYSCEVPEKSFEKDRLKVLKTDL